MKVIEIVSKIRGAGYGEVRRAAAGNALKINGVRITSEDLQKEISEFVGEGENVTIKFAHREYISNQEGQLVNE